MLVNKYKRAVKSRENTKVAYESLTDSLEEAKVNEWRAAEKQAMEERGEYLRIYEVQESKGAFQMIVLIFTKCEKLAPTKAEIALALTESTNGMAETEGSVAWLMTGILLEDSQYVPDPVEY